MMNDSDQGSRALDPDGLVTRGLVVYLGLYQAVHILVNSRGLYLLLTGVPLDFPAPPPAGGWAPDVVHLMVAIGWTDLAGAVLSLVFVFAYFRRRPWRMWLGTVVLTIVVYATALYTYWPLASGAWSEANAPRYLFVEVATLPLLLLFALTGYWAFSGREGCSSCTGQD